MSGEKEDTKEGAEGNSRMTRCGEVIFKGASHRRLVDSMLKEGQSVSESGVTANAKSHFSSPLCPPGFGPRLAPVTVEPAEFGFAFLWRKQKQAAVDRDCSLVGPPRSVIFLHHFFFPFFGF